MKHEPCKRQRIEDEIVSFGNGLKNNALLGYKGGKFEIGG